MISFAASRSEPATPDLIHLVEHKLAVPPSMSVSGVYEVFQRQPHEFLAVADGNVMVGMVSRGQVGFLLGARFGLAVYGRQPIEQHMLPHHLRIRHGTPLLEVLEAAFARQGDYFYEDVALVAGAENYLGMISMQTLVRLQSQLITEQIQLADAQRRELQEKNQQLFRSVNELRQSRGRYDILFENSALGVALLNRHGQIETCNERLENLLGLNMTPGQTEKNSLADLVPAGDRDKFLQMLRQLETFPSAAPDRCEFNLSLPARGPRWFNFFLNWIQETGQICALLEDVTEQRVLERRMQQKEKAAFLESLVGGIAHEINNKLSPIIGYADLLVDQIQQLSRTDDLQGYCLIIRDSALESAKIIRQLLQLSRPHKVEMTPCDLNQLVEDAVELLRFRLRGAECRVTLSLPARPCQLMADATQIKQVVMNLVLNAVDAMEDQPVRELSVRVLCSGKHCHLLVGDTGHGIKPEHLGRIYDPFFTTKAPDQGTGLGLSVCFSVVKQHNGEISVESAPGKGSTFKVTLPCGELLKLPTLARMPSATGSDGVFNACRVLIVDDEEFVAGLVQEALRQKLGCQIDKAAHGREAIECLGKQDYDMVISDVRMPVLDGFGLLDWIRQHQPAHVAHFLFITGDAGSAELNQELESSGVTVLRKPFDIETLVQACRQKMKVPVASPKIVLNAPS